MTASLGPAKAVESKDRNFDTVFAMYRFRMRKRQYLVEFGQSSLFMLSWTRGAVHDLQSFIRERTRKEVYIVTLRGEIRQFFWNEGSKR